MYKSLIIADSNNKCGDICSYVCAIYVAFMETCLFLLQPRHLRVLASYYVRISVTVGILFTMFLRIRVIN